MTSQTQDLEHLKLLSIFHYVAAGLTALVACIPILHLLGGFMILGGFAGGVEPAFGCLFVAIPAAFILGGWALAVCLGLVGKFLFQRRHYTFCLVVAGIECVFPPVGTVLGVFTVLVLVREPVKALFEERRPEAMPS